MIKLRREQKRRLAIILTCTLVFVFISVAIGGDFWLKNNTEDRNKGLWKWCLQGKCATYQKVEPSLRASQILGVLACVMALVGSFLALIELIVDRMFVHLIPGSLFICFLFMLSCVSTFTSYRGNQVAVDDAFGWSYVIGWLSVVVSLCAFVAAFVVERISVEEDVSRNSTLTFGWKPVDTLPNTYDMGITY